MLATLGKSLSDAFKPGFWVPGAILTLYQVVLYLVFFQFFDLVPRFLYETLVLRQNFGVGLFDSFGAFLIVNLDELFVLGLLSVLWAMGFVWILFVFTKLKSGDANSVSSAIGHTFSDFAKVAGLSLFFWIASSLFFFGCIFLVLLGVVFKGAEIFVLVLFLAWIFVGLMVYVRLLFVPAVFFSEGKRIKESISIASKWAEKKTIGILVLLAATTVFSAVLSQIALFLSDQTEIEIIGIALLFLCLSISSSFSAIAVSNYYFLNKAN